MQDHALLKQPKMSFLILDEKFYRIQLTYETWLLLITTFLGHCSIAGKYFMKFEEVRNCSDEFNASKIPEIPESDSDVYTVNYSFIVCPN